MAEGPTPTREGPIQPLVKDPHPLKKGFWEELDEIRRLLAEARLLFEELKEAQR